MDNPLPPLTASVGRLRTLVEGFDDEQLERPSYSTDWTIADVLSHLGSSAVLMARRLEAALAGAALPDDIAPPVWDEWNAKSPRAKADDALVEDERLELALAAVSEADRARIEFSFGPLSVSFDTAAALRLNEHALHTWDIEVMSDAQARLAADAANVIVDNLGLIGRFAALAHRRRAGDPGPHGPAGAALHGAADTRECGDARG